MGDHRKNSSRPSTYGHGRSHKRRALSGADEDGVARSFGRQNFGSHSGSASYSKQQRRFSLGDEGRRASGGGSQGPKSHILAKSYSKPTDSNNNSGAEGSTIGSSSSGSDSSNGVSCSHKKMERSFSTASRPSNPLRYKTELCRSYEESGECRFASSCTFAHGLSELRAVPRHPRYKTDFCRTYHSLGYCQYGTRCHFVHDPEEAAGVSLMRGHRLHCKQDRFGLYLLAMAEKAGIPQEPTTSDVLVANLKRLLALRMMIGHQESQNTTAEVQKNGSQGDSIMKGHSQQDLWELPQNMLSMSLTATDGIEAETGKLLNISNGSVSNPSIDSSVDTTTDGSADTGIFSCSSSTSTCDDYWWGAWNSLVTPPLSPDIDAAVIRAAPSRSSLERQAKVSPEARVRIETPMQISRNLQLPNILELNQI